MKVAALFSIHLTIIVLFLLVILISIEFVCWILKKIDKRKPLSERAKKWIYILDWLNDKDE